MKGKHSAFTLVELLVVVAIIAIIVSMLLPVLESARAAGRAAVCVSNEHQIGLGLTAYAIDYRNQIPPYQTWDPLNSAAYHYLIGRPGISRAGDYWIDYPIDFKLGLLAPYLNDVEQIGYCPALRNEGKEIWPSLPGWTPRREFGYGQNVHVGGVTWIGFQTDPPVRFSTVSNPAALVVFADQTGGRWYMTSPTWPWGTNPLVEPMARHPAGTCNWLFLDGHVKAAPRDTCWIDEHMLPDSYD